MSLNHNFLTGGLDAKSDFEHQLRRKFRYYSRMIYKNPTFSDYHKKRILLALQFEQNDRLIGALADYFFGCWYEIAKDGYQTLFMAADKLPRHIMSAFEHFINQGNYMTQIDTLATRFSVLVTPSMDVPVHQMYVGKDEARQVVDIFKEAFGVAFYDGDEVKMTQIESEFFNHCVACRDTMSFMMAWFAISKMGYPMHEGWQACKVVLESQALSDDGS